MTRSARQAFAILGTLLSAILAQAAWPQSFAIRDQNPLLRGLYLPHAVTRASADGRLVHQLQLTLSNTANVETRGGESLRVDGEATELRWLAAWQPAERLQVRFTVPLVHYSGGVIDGAIDEWHDAFDFAEGSRPIVPRGEFEYRYSSAVGTVQESDSGTALGDTAVEAGYVLKQTTAATLGAWLGVEMPTGDRSRLAGNEAWDLAAWIEGAGSPSQRLRLDGRIGAIHPGSAAPLPLESASWVAFGSLGATWGALPALDLRLQLDAHDSFVEDTELRLLSPALQLTLGAEYRQAGGWRLQFAITEDLRVGASPDIALHFGIQLGGSQLRVVPGQ